jgi:hypothetical protein
MRPGNSVGFLAARPFRADSLRDPCRRQTNYDRQRRNVSAALVAPLAIWRKVAVHSLRSYVLSAKTSVPTNSLHPKPGGSGQAIKAKCQIWLYQSR